MVLHFLPFPKSVSTSVNPCLTHSPSVPRSLPSALHHLAPLCLVFFLLPPVFCILPLCLQPNCAKQTQFQNHQNHPNLLHRKDLPHYHALPHPRKQTQFKSRQSRDPDANRDPIPPHPGPTQSHTTKPPCAPPRSPLHASRFTLSTKQTQFQNHRNHPNFLRCKALPQYPAPPHPKKQTQSPLSQAQPHHTPPSPPAGLPAPRFTLHASRFTKYALAETQFPNTIAQRRFYVHRSG